MLRKMLIDVLQARNHESEVTGDHMEGREYQIWYFRISLRRNACVCVCEGEGDGGVFGHTCQLFLRM